MRKRLLLVLTCLLIVSAVSAQCVVCSMTAAEMDDTSARGLNTGIVYLAFIPLGILGTVGYLWWRQMRSPAK